MPTLRNGKRKRVTKRPEDRRHELLAAAERVFAEKGVDDATVADITAAASVAKGTFYLYFQSKDHLLGMMWERYVEGFLTRATEALSTAPGSDGWWRIVTRLIQELMRHELAHADLHRIVYRTANARALEMCRQADEKIIALITDSVRRGAADGTFRQDHPELFARFLYHAADGVLDDVIMSDHAVDEDELVSAVQDLAFRALSPAAPCT